MRAFRPLQLLFLLPACSSGTTSSSAPPGESYDFASTLSATVNEVVEPTYADLADRSAALETSAEALAASPADVTLEAAREAWRQARVPWEQSEAFLFGPVEYLGVDPSIDSWPVDRVQLDQVLASGLDLTSQSIRTNFGGGLRGFHTLEYLLWGDDDTKAASAFTARELAYAVATASSLAEDAATVEAAWTGGYGQAFIASGQPGGTYPRALDAVQELLNGMISICDEVANGKIADPYKAHDPQLEESRFSHNSIQDFSDNLRSVQNVYLGARGTEASASLSMFVGATDPALDARVRAAIDAAITAILAISSDGEPFTFAITDPQKRSAIEASEKAIQDVMELLQGEVLPLLVR